MAESSAEKKSRSERTAQKLSDPEFLEDICTDIANGGCVIELCKTLDIRYSDVIQWIYKTPERKQAYESAVNARGEWFKQSILKELKRIGTVDIREAYDDQNRLKDINSIPPEVAACIVAVEVFEEFHGKGEDRELIGYTKRVKFADKTRGLELLGKHIQMFIDRISHELSGKLTLEELVGKSMQPAKTNPVPQLVNEGPATSRFSDQSTPTALPPEFENL